MSFRQTPPVGRPVIAVCRRSVAHSRVTNTPADHRPVIDICPRDAATAMGGKCAAERERRQSHHLPPGWRDKVGVFVHTAAKSHSRHISDRRPRSKGERRPLVLVACPSDRLLPSVAQSSQTTNVRWPHTRYGHCRVINIRKSSQIDGDLGSKVDLVAAISIFPAFRCTHHSIDMSAMLRVNTLQRHRTRLLRDIKHRNSSYIHSAVKAILYLLSQHVHYKKNLYSAAVAGSLSRDSVAGINNEQIRMSYSVN